MNTKTLPANITNYDLLKAAAVILMVIDHVGYYFFPEDIYWFKAFGRMCVPIWFFLIGYAHTRDITFKLIAGAAILTSFNPVVGMSVFALNILATMIFVRLLIDPVMKIVSHNIYCLVAMMGLLIAVITYSWNITEYGTQGLILAMFGYAVRHQIHIKGFKDSPSCVITIGVMAFLAFVGVQQFFFIFPEMPMYLMFAGTGAVMMILYRFKPQEASASIQKTLAPVAPILKFMGRRTLEIYVAHLILFKLIGALTQPDRFTWFAWEWYSATGV